MSDTDRSLNWTLAKLIDRYCLEFEESLRTEQNPRIEEFLNKVDREARHLLVSELLEIEVAHRTRNGEAVSQQSYRERLPNYANIIDEVFSQRIKTIVDSERKGSTYTLASDNDEKAAPQPFAEREFKN